tara:strand:+ start:146 stop:397 length:252 start_codon:yes stop_codon:yes gene_type:complete
MRIKYIDNMKEFFLDRITQIHNSNGVVHLQVTTLCPEDGYIDIEVNARELLNDIPSLHYFAKKAIKEEKEYNKMKYKKFKKIL